MHYNISILASDNKARIPKHLERLESGPLCPFSCRRLLSQHKCVRAVSNVHWVPDGLLLDKIYWVYFEMKLKMCPICCQVVHIISVRLVYGVYWLVVENEKTLFSLAMKKLLFPFKTIFPILSWDICLKHEHMLQYTFKILFSKKKPLNFKMCKIIIIQN